MKIYDYGKWTMVELCTGVYNPVDIQWYIGYQTWVYYMIRSMRECKEIIDYRVYYFNNGIRDNTYCPKL